MSEDNLYQTTFVKKWLKSNINYHNQVHMSNEELTKTAQHFVEKEDIYDCQITPASSHMTFKVRIGKPRFRGSGNYTLPTHSLVFSTYEPSKIRIVMDGSMKPPYWDKHESYILEQNNLSPDRRRLDVYRDYPVHPHVSADGEPCLGGYSQPWSQCVSTNNIPSLVNVAKAFLNTWTRGDHYWDINGYYNSWKAAYPETAHKEEFPFTDWLTHSFAWDHMKHRIGISDRGRTSFNHAFEFPALYYGDNYEEKRPDDPDKQWKMFDLYNGAMIFYKTSEDTEDRLKETIVNLSKSIGGALWNVKDSIGAEIGINNNLVDGLFEDVLMENDFAKSIVKTPGRGPRIEYQIVGEFNDIHYVLDGEARKIAQRSLTTNPLTSDMVNAYGMAMNRDEAWRCGGFLERKDILECLSFYMRRGRGRAYPYFLRALRNVIKLFVGSDVWNNDLLVEGATGIKSAEILLEGLMILKDFTDDIDEFDAVIRNHYTYEVCDRYEQILRRQIKGRITDVKRKYRPVIHSTTAGIDSSENQLSFD